MRAHDARIPLKQGYRLTLHQRDYTIRDVVGYGGSCLAYSALFDPEEYERGIGMTSIPVIIKEFYPTELEQGIAREINGTLAVHTASHDAFEILRSRFESGTVEQMAFCVNDGNHTLPAPSIDVSNGTVYSVVALTKGSILADCRDSLSMYEKSCIITSLRNAVKKLHDGGKLYLDLKPSNIFVFESEDGETRRIALFDFDTVTPVTDIAKAYISYSKGWSPYEQVNSQHGVISYTADIYAIGAVCYWLYSGKKVTYTALHEIVRGRYGFLEEIPELRESTVLAETIGELLSATLKRMPDNRAQRVEELPL